MFRSKVKLGNILASMFARLKTLLLHAWSGKQCFWLKLKYNLVQTPRKFIIAKLRGVSTILYFNLIFTMQTYMELNNFSGARNVWKHVAKLGNIVSATKCF